MNEVCYHMRNISPLIDEEEIAAIDYAVDFRKRINRKFENLDLMGEPELFDAANSFARHYKGDNSYMNEMSRTIKAKTYLSLGQARGVLNCLWVEQEKAEKEAVEAQKAFLNQVTGALVAAGAQEVNLVDEMFEVVTTPKEQPAPGPLGPVWPSVTPGYYTVVLNEAGDDRVTLEMEQLNELALKRYNLPMGVQISSRLRTLASGGTLPDR
jgi:hypothetical protein